MDALEHVVGQSAAKQKIQAMVNALQVNHRRVQAGGRAEPAPHVVLAGAAGSGKSMLARLVAHIVSECGVSRHGPLVRPSRADLVAIGRGPDEPPSSSRSSARRRRGAFCSSTISTVCSRRATRVTCGRAPGWRRWRRSPPRWSVARGRRARAWCSSSRARLTASPPQGVCALPPRRGAPRARRASRFRPRRGGAAGGPDGGERGFTLADGLVDDRRLESHVAEAARCADPTRRNAHLARSLLEAAINRQTERVFTLGTIGKDTLTQLSLGDFLGEADSEGAVAGSDAQRMQDDTEKALADLEKVVGLDGVKDFIKSLRAQLLVEKERVAAGLPSTGGASSIWSSPGTRARGKTTVARIIANLLRALGVLRRGHLVEADRSSLVAGYSGQTALKTKAVVQEALGGVLFVDEAYALVSGERDSFGKEALDTLMKEMEDHREDLVVIAAGYNDEMKELLAANPGMESRFPTLHFADYSPAELMKIAEAVLEPQRMKLGDGARELLVSHFEAEKANREPDAKGSNGRGVRNLLEAAKRAQALRLADVKGAKTVDDLTTLTAEDCATACGVAPPSGAVKPQEASKKKGILQPVIRGHTGEGKGAPGREGKRERVGIPSSPKKNA